MQQWLFAYSTHDNSINCHTIDSFTHPDLVYRRPDFIGDAMFFTDHREYVVTVTAATREDAIEKAMALIEDLFDYVIEQE